MQENRISNIRAIAILLVVFGHSIIMYSPLWGLHIVNADYPILEYMKHVINLIQMPLFFSLSGYLFYYSMQKKRKAYTFVIQKVKRLIVPYFIIAILWMIPIKLFAEYQGYQDKNIVNIFVDGILLGKDNGHLWFLPALFLIFVGIYAIHCLLEINKMEHKYNVISNAVIFIALVVVHFISDKLMFSAYLYNTAYYAIYFYLGYVINLVDKSVLKTYVNKISVKCILLITTAVFTVVSLVTFNNLIVFVSNIIWVILFYNVMPDKECKILECFSKNSFGIY